MKPVIRLILSMLLFILAVYSFIFAILPNIPISLLLPFLSNPINKLFFFLIFAYIFFIAGFLVTLGWTKFRGIFLK